MIINVTVRGPADMILPRLTARHAKGCCEETSQCQALPGGLYRLQISGSNRSHGIIIEKNRTILAARKVQAPAGESPEDAVVNRQIVLGADRIMIINLNISGADDEIIPDLVVKHAGECCDRTPVILGSGFSRQFIFFGSPLPDETHTLVVEAPGYFTDSRFVERVPDQAVYNVNMGLAARELMIITANIRGAADEEINGARLKHWTGCGCGQTPLPQGGRPFQLRFLGEPQTHRVVVEMEGYFTANQEVVPVAEQNVYYVDFVLQPGELMLIRVNVTGPDGNPVPSAKVKHGGACACGRNPQTYKEGIGGPFILKFFGARTTHVIIVEAPGYFTANQEVVPNGPQYLYDIQFELRPRPNVPDLPLPPEQPARPCGFPTLTTGKPCKRRTHREHCFQHTDKDDPALKKYAGTWIMNGCQVHVPHSGWEARLILQGDGNLIWKETRGANVGAKRNGCFSIENKALVMRFSAPVVATVIFTACNPTSNQMGGNYRTPDVDPQGAGWGGEWNAYKNE